MDRKLRSGSRSVRAKRGVKRDRDDLLDRGSKQQRFDRPELSRHTARSPPNRTHASAARADGDQENQYPGKGHHHKPAPESLKEKPSNRRTQAYAAFQEPPHKHAARGSETVRDVRGSEADAMGCPGCTVRFFPEALHRAARKERRALHKLEHDDTGDNSYTGIARLLRWGRWRGQLVHVYEGSLCTFGEKVDWDGDGWMHAASDPDTSVFVQTIGERLSQELVGAINLCHSENIKAGNAKRGNLWLTGDLHLKIVGISYQTYLGHGPAPVPDSTPEGRHSRCLTEYENDDIAPEHYHVSRTSNARGSEAEDMFQLARFCCACWSRVEKTPYPVNAPSSHYSQYLARDLLDAGGGLRMRGHMLEHLLARNPADRPSSFEAVVNPAFLNDEEKEDLLCMASTGAARNDRGRIPAFAARLEAIMLASIRGGKRWTARQALTMARNAVEHWAEGRPKGPMRGCPRDKHAMLRRIENLFPDLYGVLLALAVSLPADEAENIRLRLDDFLPSSLPRIEGVECSTAPPVPSQANVPKEKKGSARLRDFGEANILT
ncbi:hypothetical protein WJX84_004911 [Apatococcus fuscideae]|uniref:Protein kinase domain-containing protein n=1 Tax=Apatococcus fuscideae TaxID=2026836 RepID=A0AAW1T516_9CHLO